MYSSTIKTETSPVNSSAGFITVFGLDNRLAGHIANLFVTYFVYVLLFYTKCSTPI